MIAWFIMGIYFLALIGCALHAAIEAEQDAIRRGHTRRWDDYKP